MMLPLDYILFILYALLLLVLFIVLLIFFNKIKLRFNLWQSSKIKTYLIDRYMNKKPVKKHFPKHKLTNEFINICEQTLLEPVLRKEIIDDFHTLNIVKYYIVHLNSFNPNKRKFSAHYLGFFESKEALDAIKNRLLIEKNNSVKLYLLNALKNHLDDYIDIAINSLVHADEFYRQRAIAIIKHYHNTFSLSLQASNALNPLLSEV